MSRQALILAIVYAILILLTFILSLKNKTFGVFSVFGIIISIAIAALIVYDTSCLTSELPCTVWSWIRTILYVIFPVLGVIAGLMALFSSKKQEHTPSAVVAMVPLTVPTISTEHK